MLLQHPPQKANGAELHTVYVVRCHRALFFECADRGTTWVARYDTKLVRPKMFAKHEGSMLRVKGRNIVVKSPKATGSAFLNESITSGTFVAEFRIVNLSADDSDIFMGIVKSDQVETNDYWFDEDFAGKAWLTQSIPCIKFSYQKSDSYS